MNNRDMTNAKFHRDAINRDAKRNISLNGRTAFSFLFITILNQDEISET
jgi:hypothetical protein